MSEVDDEVKGEGDDGEKKKQQASTKTVIADTSDTSTAVVPIQQTEYELPEYHKENYGGKKKEGACQTENDDTLTTVRLLGEPLVTHGPYTFYSALEYRKRGNETNGERQRCKKQQSIDSCDSSSSCCCSSIEADNDSCSCSVSSSRSEWSVIRMNHFYAVRPWYSIRNSSDRQQLRRRRRRRHRKNSSKLSTSTAAVERSQHHYQQSVCIGELELLWRDDSIETTSVPSSSLIKKRSTNRVVPSPLMTTSNGGGDEKIDAITNSHSNSGVAASSDEDDGVGNDDDSPLMLPRRRMLPRRTRQPSAKKLEAAESCAAVAAAVSDNNPLQKSCNRSRQSTVPSSDPSPVAIPLSSPGSQYKHGNLLCSVRLYVMPDQTAAGRIGGIHGEDEVLEINTWNANGGVDRWPGSLFLNGGSSIGSIYNGGGVDDYGYGSGSHSSGTLPSGCSGLVLRAEDFVEWVRGGLINDDDEIEDTESENEFLESESGDDQKSIKTEMPEQGHDKQPKLISDVKSIHEILYHDKTKVKLESTLTTDGVKKEKAIIVDQSLSAIDLGKIEKDVKITGVVDRSDNFNTSAKDFFYDDNRSLNSAVNEAVKAERVPLAAAKIHKKQSMPIRRHDQNCDSLVNGVITNNVNIKQEHLDPGNSPVGPTVDEKNDNNHKADCKRHLGFQNKNKKIKTCGGSSKQKLVVMSYSRYCRYRAQLQRRREEQFGRDCITNRDDAEKAVTKYQEANTKTTTRVLFCRDTYDYPAELLLEPFNAQQGHHQNATVLVNHMAPKLKGWPAYPASWMSFRWNRVRRRLRHLERGSGDNEDRRRRRRRRKLKKTCRQRQNGTSGVGINYTSSTDDDYSDDSDSEDVSSATNDAATNSTTTSSTSDSDGAPPLSSVMPKTVNKNLSSASSKVNGGVHHNTKKTLSVSSTSSMVIINGATTVSAVVNNKRNATSTVQPGLQQLTKRRRIIYTTGSQTLQHHQQRVLNQQQQPQNPQPRQQQSNHRPRQLLRYHQFGQSQRNQNSLVVQQQQPRLHSFHRRLPTPIASIQPATTRIIHHHLPPSVTIMPVVVPTTNTASQQQQQRFNNRLQNRQKQHSSATILATSQRRSNISDTQQMSLPPVIIEYDDDDNHDYVSDDNGRYKKSTIAAAMVACQRRVEQYGFEDDQRQQREEEERQRRWLVNALRLGGLEVTAVPLNSNNSGSGSNKVVSNSETETPQQQQQKQWRQRGVSFETLLSTDNEHDNSGFEQHHGGDGDDDSIQESDSDSVVMTVTPDVICILNKSQQQESMETKHQQQMSSRGDPTSTASITMTQHQQKRRHSINLNDSSCSSDQRQHPVVTAAAAAAALHDKINRAIDSLKQQQQQKSNTTTPISNNNKKQQKQRKNSVITGIRQQQTPSSLLDLSVKPSSMSNITTRQQKLPLPAITNSSLKQLQQQRKSQSPFHAVPMTGPSTAAASLEITIVPVTASSTTSSTKLLSQQQKRSLSATGTHNLTSGFETQSSACSSFPKMIRQQSQRRNTTVTSSATVSESIIEMLCGGRNRNLHPQRNGRSVSVTTTSSSSQQQILEMAASATAATQSQHQIDKRKPQQHKKD